MAKAAPVLLKRIDSIDENIFGNNEIKLDGSVLLKRISISSMQNRIQQLTNAEVQYRLNLWMSYSPDIIAADLGILSLPNYFVFVYNEIGLIVLESFEAGNAYFCINSADSFENTINSISTFSKSEILNLARCQNVDTTSRTSLHLKTISDGTLGESTDE